MNTYFTQIMIVFLIGLTLMNSCKKEEGCMDKQSENYNSEAVVDDASCTYARDQFIGIYNVSLSCVYEGDTSFNMSVTKGPNIDEIILENFDNFNVNILAKVSNNNISFKDEQLGIVFEGDGYIVDNKMSISFEVCEAYYYPCSDPDYCTKTCIQQ